MNIINEYVKATVPEPRPERRSNVEAEQEHTTLSLRDTRTVVIRRGLHFTLDLFVFFLRERGTKYGWRVAVSEFLRACNVSTTSCKKNNINNFVFSLPQCPDTD
jgi:hypothetical protein